MDAPRARIRIGVQQGDSAGSWRRGADHTNPGLASAGAGSDAWKDGCNGGGEGGMARG